MNRRSFVKLAGATAFFGIAPSAEGKTPGGKNVAIDRKALVARHNIKFTRPDQAIEALFMDTPKNSYLANGHNYQQSILPLYLPGNGGLLFAVAMMAAGWKGAPAGNAPGFPTANNGWTVRWEGLRPAL